ncbi:DUF5947 family protein [Streptomyces sp. ACA25]|uniref:DUF5947 family protein n=1 Tax=Streptomyces sp. ACA25 TaxID=3022596 RepID=UPI0023070B68|nr:DUF5947 family protein [Streptomyces sp. ACA25]MDB1088534.1 DUF5947 family protein [Streptomyces sp. ACA25]
MPAPFPAPTLARLARQPGPPGATARRTAAAQERCDLCAEPLPGAEHRHLLDLRGGGPACACRACTVLFDREAAGGGRYRLLPERRLRLDHCTIDDLLWASLGIPVDLAFFLREGETGEVSAGYPSPLGVMRAAVHPESWQAITAGRPDLTGMADDVEALLVNRAGTAHEHWIVPLDDCYRLAALVRTHWKGLSGGAEVRERVGAFFTGLTGHS